ncbi:polysaccharide deacetylase family protein [Paenibacillus harenae]|uniref:polysaccharide deacetylase family protein n=1 Tax=Paenibacillus harenae TaxID=306543 RepID=UPI000408FE42
MLLAPVNARLPGKWRDRISFSGAADAIFKSVDGVIVDGCLPVDSKLEQRGKSCQAMVHRVPTQTKIVAFMFDDGPNPVYTPQLLEIFRKVGGKATFFMLGSQIDVHPDTAAAVHAEGHEIANHKYTHPYLTRLTTEEAR